MYILNTTYLELLMDECQCFCDSYSTGSTLALLHSDRPQLYGVLAVLSSIGLKLILACIYSPT